MALTWISDINEKEVFGADIKAGIHATILCGLFLGLDANGDAVLADNRDSVSQVAARGASYDNGTYGTTTNVKNKARASFVRSGKLTGFSGLTPNALVYLSSGGGITTTKPTTSDELIQEVGFVYDATTIYVDISPESLAP